jgi:hypothetical protein
VGQKEHMPADGVIGGTEGTIRGINWNDWWWDRRSIICLWRWSDWSLIGGTEGTVRGTDWNDWWWDRRNSLMDWECWSVWLISFAKASRPLSTHLPEIILVIFSEILIPIIIILILMIISLVPNQWKIKIMKSKTNIMKTYFCRRINTSICSRSTVPNRLNAGSSSQSHNNKIVWLNAKEERSTFPQIEWMVEPWWLGGRNETAGDRTSVLNNWKSIL